VVGDIYCARASDSAQDCSPGGAICCFDPADGGILDATTDAHACANAPVIRPDAYDDSCTTDTDCVNVPPGGSTCSFCPFQCDGVPLSEAGAVQYQADYNAALATWADPTLVCGGACGTHPALCCISGTCRNGSACAGDAGNPDAANDAASGFCGPLTQSAADAGGACSVTFDEMCGTDIDYSATCDCVTGQCVCSQNGLAFTTIAFTGCPDCSGAVDAVRAGCGF